MVKITKADKFGDKYAKVNLSSLGSCEQNMFVIIYICICSLVGYAVRISMA